MHVSGSAEQSAGSGLIMTSPFLCTTDDMPLSLPSVLKRSASFAAGFTGFVQKVTQRIAETAWVHTINRPHKRCFTGSTPPEREQRRYRHAQYRHAQHIHG